MTRIWRIFCWTAASSEHIRVPLELPVSFDLAADKVVVRSQRPLVVKLSEHDLKPRNAEGRLVSSELGLLGTRVGREARVDVELVFGLAAAKKEQQE